MINIETKQYTKGKIGIFKKTILFKLKSQPTVYICNSDSVPKMIMYIPQTEITCSIFLQILCRFISIFHPSPYHINLLRNKKTIHNK